MEAESINRSPRMRMSTFAMFAIGLTMWVGVPIGWLYVGSMVKSSTDSLNLAVIVMGVGALVTIVGLVKALGVLNRTYQQEFATHNGHDPQKTPLEPVLVISAMLALAAFGVWFLFFAGGGGASIAPT
jgi:formate hydrogenlyase subunit 3/multisubunit Na+/H+ antiporter MnhD subunit